MKQLEAKALARIARAMSKFGVIDGVAGSSIAINAGGLRWRVAVFDAGLWNSWHVRKVDVVEQILWCASSPMNAAAYLFMPRQGAAMFVKHADLMTWAARNDWQVDPMPIEAPRFLPAVFDWTARASAHYC